MELTNWFKQEKLKLPKAMRRMPLKQFIEDYGESASQILLATSRCKYSFTESIELNYYILSYLHSLAILLIHHRYFTVLECRDPVSGPGVHPQTAVKAEKSAAIDHLGDNSISVVSKHEAQIIPAQTPSKRFIHNPSSLVMETPGRIARNGEVIIIHQP